MLNADYISTPLAKTFVELAQRAESDGHASGSTAERIVAALLNNRSDWLPPNFIDPLSAIKRLHAGGPEWWHTMLFVHDAGWCTRSGKWVESRYRW